MLENTAIYSVCMLWVVLGGGADHIYIYIYIYIYRNDDGCPSIVT